MTKLILAGVSLWLLGTPSLAGEVLVKQTDFARGATQPDAVKEAPGPELGTAATPDSAALHLEQLIQLHREATTTWTPPPNP